MIFDFYGVIRSDEYQDWLTLHGYKRDTKIKNATSKLDKGLMSADEFFESLSKLSNIPPEEIRQEFLAHASLNERLLSLILDLKKSYKIAILSNASSSHLRQVLNDAGINKLFDEVVVSSDIGYTKPSKEIFDHTLNKLGVKAEEALFVDDSPRFVEAAESMGIKGIVYTDLNSLISALKEMGIIKD